VSIAALLRAVAVNEPIPLPADLALPESPDGGGVVDVKHHVQEALAIVPFASEATLEDDYVLALAYVDARANVALDLPGGKRKLAETAWEAAAREMADECKLAVDVGADAFRGADARLAIADDLAFEAYQFVDGQSVRFFVLRSDAQTDRAPDAAAAAPEDADAAPEPEAADGPRPAPTP